MKDASKFTGLNNKVIIDNIQQIELPISVFATVVINGVDWNDLVIK